MPGVCIPASLHEHPGSYNMTITSTASTGAGLHDFGVFQNQKVYTVYLDMRSNDEDSAPSWTLQYAALQPSATDHANSSASRIEGDARATLCDAQGNSAINAGARHQVRPSFVVVSAIMNTTGTSDCRRMIS
jgi:hypothetical protein